MSTPTPSNPAHSSKTPHAHNASTPNTMSHLGAFSSPAARNAASPAAHRNNISGKSPMTLAQGSAPTLASHNHPTGSSAGGASDAKRGGLLGSSPAGVGINFDSPSGALGLNLGSVGAVDMGVSMSQMGGLGMGLSMSGLGMGMIGGSSLGLGSRTDDERRRTLQIIVSLLGSVPGRVCEDGIRRTAKKVGLDTSVDEDKNSQKTMILAGRSSLMVDVQIKSDIVEKVKMECDDASEAWSSTSDVLYRNLTPSPGGSKLNLTLEKFSGNLEILAQLEKLSTPSINCFSAISGLYDSLQKLFVHEKKTAVTQFNSEAKHLEEKVERHVMCKKSGRPRMNANDRIGLTLEYWMDERHIFNQPKSKTSPPVSPAADRMDIDEPARSAEVLKGDQVYSIQIECEAYPVGMYPAIRISDSWLSDVIEKKDSALENMGGLALDESKIDWLEPPPTYVQEETENISAIANEKLPGVRFVARFSPPVILPLGVATELTRQLQSPLQPEHYRPVAWDSLVLHPGSEGEIVPVEAGTKKILNENLVLVPRSNDCDRVHQNILELGKDTYGIVLEQVPFEHPRQLVQMLPTLRRFAMLNSLVYNSFSSLSTHSRTAEVLASPDAPQRLPSIEVNVSLDSLAPQSRLTAAFPRLQPIPTMQGLDDDTNLDDILGLPREEPPISINFEVGDNAKITILSQNLDTRANATSANTIDHVQDSADTTKSDGTRAEQTKKRIASALDLAPFIGIWVEWLRSESAKAREDRSTLEG